MNKYLVLFCLFFINTGWADDYKASSSSITSYKSYSYTLMDEMAKKSTNAHDYNKVVVQSRSSQGTAKNKNYTEKFFFYTDELRDILSIDNLDQKNFLGNKYIFGDFAANFDYSWKSKIGNKETQSTSFHIEYNFAPGITPYFETKNLNNINNFDKNLLSKKRATLFLIGTKIEF
jgi:hypothetical protein